MSYFLHTNGLLAFVDSLVGDGCPGCGLEPTAQSAPQIEVMWPGVGEPPQMDPEPEPCPQCGRVAQIHFLTRKPHAGSETEETTGLCHWVA